MRQYMTEFHGNDKSSLTDVERDSIVDLWNAVLGAYVQRGGATAWRHCARIVPMMRRDKHRRLIGISVANARFRIAPLQLTEMGEKPLRQIRDLLADPATYCKVMLAWVKADKILPMNCCRR